jgi:hypothetical protein
MRELCEKHYRAEHQRWQFQHFPERLAMFQFISCSAQVVVFDGVAATWSF